MKQYIGIDVSKKKIDVMWLKDQVTGKGKSKVLGNLPPRLYREN